MNCKEGNQQIITQMIALLEKLDNQIYTLPLDVFKGSSIGQHFRHILDFYNCLINGVQFGTVDYASRKRNPSAETDVEFTKMAFNQVSEMIHQFAEEEGIRVRGDFSTHITERPELLSSIGRELMFAYDHAVHHLAMIKIGIEMAMPQFPLDNNLGVAPSTIKHRNGLVLK